jgi:hypothetical protein
MNKTIQDILGKLYGPLLLGLGLLLGCFLLFELYGFSFSDTKTLYWRDHPFDWGNILFTVKSLSFQSRLWAYDPQHMFGWTPNVFYNPLATLGASLFIGIFGDSQSAYQTWLVLVLIATSYAFLPFLKETRYPILVFVGLLTAGMSLLAYPSDRGILEASLFQVLYTGQWAQRLGVALGMLSIVQFWRAVQKDYPHNLKHLLLAAIFWGTSLFSHFMSGYATGAAIFFLALLHQIAGRLTSSNWSFRKLWILPAVLVLLILLFADFFYVIFSVNHSHHSLPLLKWKLAPASLAAVKEVLLPALTILLLPLLSIRSAPKEKLLAALLPLVVLTAVLVATPSNLLLMLPIVVAISLAASWQEKEFQPRHWLPCLAFFLLVLSCGEESLTLFGFDLSLLIPFGSSLGWAKFAAFARFLFIAWLGVLVVEGIAAGLKSKSSLLRICPILMALCGLLLPVSMSTSAKEYFAWMNKSDQKATQHILERIQQVAQNTPADGYLMVEDTLRPPENSSLYDYDLPHGHLPYLSGVDARRPILGGTVTTRLISHPLAHTSRRQILCRDYQEILKQPAAVFDHLRLLSISDILVHSQDLVQALENYPAAHLVDNKAGLSHFAFENYRPILGDDENNFIADGQIKFTSDSIELDLPPNTSKVRLRQIYYPFLACRAQGADGPSPCRLNSWNEGPTSFSNCLVGSPEKIEIDFPWIEVELDSTRSASTVKIYSQPAYWPFILMILAWLGSLGLLIYKKTF